MHDGDFSVIGRSIIQTGGGDSQDAMRGKLSNIEQQSVSHHSMAVPGMGRTALDQSPPWNWTWSCLSVLALPNSLM